MSLVSGPGRGGASADELTEELGLVIDKHVEYIKSLDTVRCNTAAIVSSHSSCD